jgi:hypothetical protein
MSHACVSCCHAVVHLHPPAAELCVDMLDPSPAIIAAALELVYGLLPAHIAVNEHSAHVGEEWAWAIGSQITSSVAHSSTVTGYTRHTILR